MLAVRFRWEFARLAAHLMKTYGVLPAAVNEQTPHQLFDAAFGKSAEAVAPAQPADPLDVLAKLNKDLAGKGMPPVSQLFGKVLTHLPDA